MTGKQKSDLSGFEAMHTVVHLTSAHTRYDTRIFLKECCSLSMAGFAVSLIVADGKGYEEKGSVNIYDVGMSQGRMNRMFYTTDKIFTEAKKLNADIYHLHDPELMSVGIKLKKMGKKVIFDAHEDLPRQLLSKPYLTPFLLKIISIVVEKYEEIACKHFNAIVAATPFIRDKFLKINFNSVDINNFPMQKELVSDLVLSWNCRHNNVCYMGNINKIRGIREITSAMDLLTTDTRLQLAGNFIESAVETEVKNYAGWQRVDEHGLLDRRGVRDLLAHSFAGIVTFHPLPNHIDSQPNKMFEYMSAGIPVIASDFPLWRKIIEENHCGICVDPLDPKAIAHAIDYLATHPDEAREMGKNGQRAIQEYYNWAVEAEKLLKLYGNL